MKISRIEYDTATAIAVDGYLGGAYAGELENFLTPLLSGRGPHHIVIDLAGVTEMSSAGLRVLISAIKRTRSNKSGDIRLAAPSKRVVEVLELAGLSTVIQIYPDRVEAVASFASPES
jgi:anti-anti-sigma factor